MAQRRLSIGLGSHWRKYRSVPSRLLLNRQGVLPATTQLICYGAADSVHLYEARDMQALKEGGDGDSEKCLVWNFDLIEYEIHRASMWSIEVLSSASTITQRENQRDSECWSPIAVSMEAISWSIHIIISARTPMTKSFIQQVSIYILNAAVNTLLYASCQHRSFSSCWSYLIQRLLKVTALFVRPCSKVICPMRRRSSRVGGRSDRAPYWSRFFIYFTFRLDNRSQAVVYVAMGVDIILLGDSMKLYKLATFSCKLHQQNS
jgi:hypothetical protein